MRSFAAVMVVLLILSGCAAGPDPQPETDPIRLQGKVIELKIKCNAGDQEACRKAEDEQARLRRILMERGE